MANLKACWICAALWLTTVSVADDWPQFRGPDGQGHSSEINLPTHWSAQENLAWRTEIPGLGWSSPVVQGNRIWLTTAIEAEGSLRVIAVEADSGQIVHNTEVFQKADLGRINAKNSHASPTPVLDGDHLYVHFGAQGTACLDLEGRVVWRTELAYNQHHGSGASPVVYRDLVIVSCDGADQQFVVALDRQSGRERWRQVRQGKNAYSTPLVIRAAKQNQLVAAGGDGVWAYAPETGSELWNFRYEGHSVIPRPVYGGNRLYVCSGYWTPSLYALRVDGHGDVTNTHLDCVVRRGVPFTSSPLLVDNQLYLVSDRGIVTCLDAKTSEELWTKRVAGNYSASPVYADGKIYILNEEATTTVLSAGPEFEALAVNELDGQSLASLAISNQSIYLRTSEALYCIREARAVGAVAEKSAALVAPEPGTGRIRR